MLIVDEAVAFGGSIVSTANLIRGLDRDRFEPVFVTAASEEHVRTKLKEASPGTTVIVARKVLDYARLQRLRGAIQRIVPFAPARKLLIYAMYGLRLLLNAPYTARIAWAIVRHRADVVQFNNGFGNDEAALACRLLRREPIAFIRGYSPAGFVDRLLLKNRIRTFVAVSEYERGRAIDDGVEPDRVLVATPSAVPEDPHVDGNAIRARHGVDPEAPVVGIFGRIVPWKGQLQFMRAAAVVLEDFPSLRIFVVGDASDGDEAYVECLRRQVEELGIADNVVFTGYVDDVHAHYRAMDVVAHASVEPEPSGRVIFEAMANGVPVVASRLGGPVEFIEHGVDGFLIDPEDTAAFAESLRCLLVNPGLRDSMGRRGREKVEHSYGLEAYARQVEEAYERCLPRRLSPSATSPRDPAPPPRAP